MIDDTDPLAALDALQWDEFGLDIATTPHADASTTPAAQDSTPEGATVQREQPSAEPAVQPSAIAALTALDTPDGETAEPLKDIAGRVARKLLSGIEAAHDAGKLDVDDAAAMLPKVHRVKIDEEKVELQRSGGKEDLPVFHITIGAAGVRAERVQAAREMGLVERVEGAEEEPGTLAAVSDMPKGGISVTFESV